MRAIVVYHSKTGFTKKYAEWISEVLTCNIVELKKTDSSSLDSYDVVIFGGGLMAGQIGGLKKFKTIVGKLNKRLVVFATGATPGEDKKIYEQTLNANFSEEEKKKVSYFYFQSGVNYENMGIFSKMMMKMLSAMLAKKKDATPEELEMAKAIKNSSDFSRKEYIEPLVKYVRSIM